MTPPTVDDPEKSIGYVMGRTFMRLRHGLCKVFEAQGHPLTPEQWSVLMTLNIQDGLAQCELGDRTVRDKTTITRILDRLEAKGLLERRRDGKDRRCQQVFLTDNGRQLYASLVPKVHAYRDEVFGALEPHEIETLRTFLAKISVRIV